MYRLICILLTLTFVNGCSTGLDNDYSCDKVGGVGGCTTMHEVRENIDHYANPDNHGNNPHSDLNEAESLVPSFSLLPRRDRTGKPERTEEITRKVTIFPFEDETGSYIDTTDIYIVLKEAEWTGRPVQAIKKD
ncbi:type IV conjugative transfer system lipoprotein TraV [Vibrio sonorensis]|uniref:type IV conjugative transfer system lipoprotein TraV n=1 Tax=Vibrio sonorensis TaxID=1004316 RepID=UPI0008D9AAFB|nr:type IV conjugative transfer system lipoprotein TraV [Vibrio sonorensis]